MRKLVLKTKKPERDLPCCDVRESRHVVTSDREIRHVVTSERDLPCCDVRKPPCCGIVLFVAVLPGLVHHIIPYLAFQVMLSTSAMVLVKLTFSRTYRWPDCATLQVR